jgi:hypothetical protein
MLSNLADLTNIGSFMLMCYMCYRDNCRNEYR